MITKKLEYHKTKLRFTQVCAYCGKENLEFIVVISPNEKVFEFFNRPKLGNSNKFYLCPECFEKLKDLLQDIEVEGWSIIEEDEFPDLDNELEGENGSER